MGILRDPGTLVLLGVIAATLLFLVYARRRHAPVSLVAVGTIDFFCGLITFALAVLHLGAVVGRALLGRGFGGAASFAYDFRFYSLVLVGLLIAVPGFLCVLSAWGLSRGETSAWRRAVYSSGFLLMINVPLIPIQGFAIGLTGFALLNLIVLWVSQKRFRATLA
jgi:hypothetical protein